MGRFTEQRFLPKPRVVLEQHLSSANLREMGQSEHRCLCDRGQHEMQPLLHEGRLGPCLPRRRNALRLERRVSLYVSSNPSPTQNNQETTATEGENDSYYAMVASEGLVSTAFRAIRGTIHKAPSSPRPDLSSFRANPPPRHSQPFTDSMEDRSHEFSLRVNDILLQSVKPSTRKSYNLKWSRFCKWVGDKTQDPTRASLNLILDFLIHLHDSGLSLSSLRVYLAALSAYHTKIDSFSLFSHPTTKRFLRGMYNAHPPPRPPPPQRRAQPWDLLLVLRGLTRHPFDPASSSDLRLLSWKTLFLVAVTSGRRVSELAALDCRPPPFIVFLPHSVRLSPNLEFLPKVVSEFHLNATIMLPDFFPNPVTPEEKLYHTLDVTRALKFYLHRTSFPNRHNSLFVSYLEGSRGRAVSSQRLSKWIVQTITLCYSLSKTPLPACLTAHSTRSMAASTAFLHGVPLEEICRAATWRTPNTFIKHYAMEPRTVLSGHMGRTILQTSLH